MYSLARFTASVIQFLECKLKLEKVLTLTEEDVDNYKAVKGCPVNWVLVPASRRHTFWKSKAFKACLPMVDGHNKFLFYKN